MSSDLFERLYRAHPQDMEFLKYARIWSFSFPQTGQMPRYMGCGILPISDFRTLAMTFHPLIVRPTDVRSARFFGGFFSTLLEDDLGFVDVGSGVCVGPTSGPEPRILV